MRPLRALAAVSVVLLACGANGGADASASRSADELAVQREMQSDGGAGGMGDVVGFAVLRSGDVVVGDAANAQLVRIDTTGRNVSRAGRRGASTGEYSRLQWVGVCGTAVVAHDIALSRLTQLDDTLGVSGTRTIPKSFDSRDVAGCLADGRTLILNDSFPRPAAGVQRHPLALVAFDARTGRADTLRRFRGNEVNYVRHLGTSIAVPLGARTHIAVAGATVLVAESDADSLWRYDGVRWKAVALEGVPGPQRPNAAVAERARQALLWAPRTTADKAFAPALLAETSTAGQAPRIDALVAADDGTAWIGWTPAPNGMRNWVQYDANGKRTASAQFPWSFDARIVRGARWWGVERDSIGVESVVRYRVGAAADGAH